MNDSDSKISKLGLEPILSPTMAEIVEVKLLEYFKKNKFKIDDPIPKEMELAESLGVSRNVIREALSRFRMLGLVESKKKRGMVLKSANLFGGMEKIMHPRFLSDQTLKEIFEMRLVIEMGIADIVFIKKTKKDLEYLKKITSQRAKNSSTKFNLEYEVEFHGKLYAITKNKTLSTFQHLLLPIFQYVTDYEMHSRLPPKVGSVTHEGLIDELENGSPESFRHAMYLHLEPQFDKLAHWQNES